MPECEVLLDEESNTYYLCFDIPGTKVMRAVWLARNNRLARDSKLDSGDISDTDIAIALWDSEEPLEITTKTPLSYSQELSLFGQDTPGAVEELRRTETPDFENPAPTQRIALGRSALYLAARIDIQVPLLETQNLQRLYDFTPVPTTPKADSHLDASVNPG